MSMDAPILEYRNQNELRKFPFSEAATCLDATGRALPEDMFVDALLSPPDSGSGVPYLLSLDFVARTVALQTGTGVAYTGSWGAGDSEVWVYEDATPYRQVGVLVFGSGAASAVGRYEFDDATMPLEASVCMNLTQAGVRGFLLPDGTLVTGDVVFTGGEGVRVRTYTSGAVPRLRVDVIGAPSTSDVDDCLPCGLVRCLRLSNSAGSLIVPSGAPMTNDVRNHAWLAASGFDLATLCAKSAAPRLPSAKRDTDEWCGDDEVCDPLVSSPAGGVTICPEQGRLHITTPSSVSVDNPLRITSEQRVPENPALLVPGVTADVDALGRKIARAGNSDKQSIGVITLGFRHTEGVVMA